MSTLLLSVNFLDETERFTKHHLNKKNDLQKIIDIASSTDNEKAFHELAFTAKYIKGLMRIVNKAPSISEVESIETVKKDISENIKKVVDQLRQILRHEDNVTGGYFEEDYFSLNQKCMQNLNLLLEDLEAVKKYLNYVKRK